jgi:hypothetical protein
MATTKKTAAPAKPAAELRVYLTLTDLQPQFSSWMSSPLGARGYVAMQGTNALLVEIAPGLSIQRVIDLALKAEPSLEPGILAVERQFGVLELHSNDSAALQRAGQVILDWMGAKAQDQLRPHLLYSDILEDVVPDRQHGFARKSQGPCGATARGDSRSRLMFADSVEKPAKSGLCGPKLVRFFCGP